MTNQKQTRKRRLNMAERAKEQMGIQFPNHPDELLWHRSQNDGYSTIPRTLPIAMQAIDAQSKGQPAGHTLLCLWIRAPDYPFLMIEAPATLAAETGFEGERAIDTWRRRMRLLRDLGFIEARKGASGDFHYVLLLNPNVAVEKLRRENKVQDFLYGRFRDRLIDIGAHHDIADYDAYCESIKQSKDQTITQKKKNPETPTKRATKTTRVRASSRASNKSQTKED